MSTRAIVGIQHADGSILGAWQWNDGNALTGLLNRKFNTLEKAQALIAEGMWSVMYTSKELEEYKKFLMQLASGSTQIKEKVFVEVNGIWLVKDCRWLNVAPTKYSSYTHAAGQDINHIYLFNPITSKWVRDKNLYNK